MLIESAKKNNTGLMTRIFEECGSGLDVSPKDALGNTPLHYSASGGHIGALLSPYPLPGNADAAQTH